MKNKFYPIFICLLLVISCNETSTEEGYILNTSTGEVHNSGCSYLPSSVNSESLGSFSNTGDAISEARSRYPGLSIDRCGHCL